MGVNEHEMEDMGPPQATEMEETEETDFGGRDDHEDDFLYEDATELQAILYALNSRGKSGLEGIGETPQNEENV